MLVRKKCAIICTNMTSRRIFTITGAFIIAAAPLAAFAQWSGAPGTPPGNNIPGPVWLQGSSPTTQSGHFSVTGGRFSDDIYQTENNKALRVDGPNVRNFNISNYTGTGFNLGVRGNITLTNFPGNPTPSTLTAPRICLNGDCRTSWPTGTAADIWVNTTGDAMTGQLNVTATANPLSTNAAIQGIFSVAGGAGVRGYGTGSGGTGLYGAGEAYGGVFSITNDSGYDIGVYASGGLEEGVRGYGSSYGVRGIGGSEGGNFEGVTGAVGYGSSIGVFGYNTVAGGYGVYGRAPLDGSVGVRARADGANSTGLLAQGSGTNSNGIEAYGTNYGIYANGNAYGARIISGSTGVGVQGEGGNYGAVFSASASSGQGVRAQGGGYGGYFIGTGNGVGVRGQANGGYGGWFEGYYGLRAVGAQGPAVEATGDITTNEDITAGGNITADGRVLAGSGSAGSPAYAFNGDGNTGIFRSGGNSIALATDGVNRLNLTTSQLHSAVPFVVTGGSIETFNVFRSGDGIAAVPAYGFGLDTDTGMYRTQHNEIGFATGGVQRVAFNGIAPYAHKQGGSTWGTTLSDGRLKDITRPFTYGLNEIMQIKPLYFTFKEGNPDGFEPDQEQLGFIAQELQKVMPEMIGVREDGYLNVKSYDPILWAMLNAIKELKAENDSLKSELNDLKSRVEKLEAAIAN